MTKRWVTSRPASVPSLAPPRALEKWEYTDLPPVRLTC